MTQTSLRKIGNSAGIVLPRSILGQIGATTGAAMDLRVEDGKLIVTPVQSGARAGWAAATAEIALHDDLEEALWQSFGNEDDADLTW